MNQTQSAGVPAYIEVSAEVRYWEDAAVNGAEDADGSLIPFKREALWCPVIRLSDGQVMDWPAGTEADVHYKVCDAGEYWLLDAERRRIAKWTGFYVPSDFLCHGDDGYGDYIILKVGPAGVIEKWTAPRIEWAREEGDEDDDPGWKRIPVPTVPGITLTLEQARTLAEALDISHDTLAAEAESYHQSMAGHYPALHKAEDERVAAVKAAGALLGQLIQGSGASTVPATDALDAARYRWLRDVSVPPHNFYLSVPIEFDGVRYTPAEVDAAIDAARASSSKEGA